jgi:Zn-finger nucleic acid-binding protein
MNYDYCKECGKKLTGINQKRLTPRTCYQCRGIKTNNYEFENICKKILKQKTTPAKEEMVFEDDPKAVNEKDYGRVSRKSTGHVHTETAMADLIIETKK